MVKIRLRRTGKKKQPSYRVVVTDSRSPRDGRFVESIGFYNPRTEPPTVQIKEDRALYWLSQGAQPTDAVARLLRNKGTLDRFTRLKEGQDLESLLAEAAAEEVVVEQVTPVEEAPVEEAIPTEEKAAEEILTADEEVPSEEELIEAPLEEEIEETTGEETD
jgi:small subunit ribosomal protein S16